VASQFFESRKSSWLRGVLFASAVLGFSCSYVRGQEQTPHAAQPAATSLDDRLRALQEQLLQMQSAMAAMHDEILRSRAESADLRHEMEATRSLLAAQSNPSSITSQYSAIAPSKDSSVPASTSAASSAQSGQAPDENQQLINAKLAELHQTKVESASKYRVRLSGIVLLNAVENRGAVDNLDFPSLAVASPPGTPNGSFAATLRQSLLGLEVFGPEIHGARISGNVQFDFAGGFPSVPDGSTFGLMRLRTGVVRLEWPNTTFVAGQDAPFFSPLSPSSIASLAVPEFSYSGNLWTWIPQVRLERRIRLGESSKLVLQGGILDPLSGERSYSSYLRTPLAGEASRQPAYAMRIAWSHHLFDHDLILGVGSFYSRQNWEFGRNVDAWAGTADWIVPLARRWELSGEFYRGRGIGGLGGGLGRSVVFTGPITDPNSTVEGLNAVGGWSQLKFRQTEKLEWNAAYGLDNSLAEDLRDYPFTAPGNYSASLARNRSGFFNFIYRPRSDLLFSVEYRRLQTISIVGDSQSADHISIGIGVLF
jgi:hypothetical protein